MLLGQPPTRVLFFTGKGGVGKTSVACATAVMLAQQGRRVLLVSTDPASNLDEVLQTPLSPTPTPIAGVPGLMAANLDPVAAAAAYRERVVGPYRNLLPAAAIRSMEEQLSGACTVEIAAFDEFSKLLGDPRASADMDHVIFDTAPTGHTLRLLSLPSAWSGFLETNTGGTSCLGPLAGLERQRQLYATTAAALIDPQQTTLVLVTRPERAALREAERTRQELSALGVQNQILVINGVFHAESDDPLAQAIAARGATALAEMAPGLAALPRTELPLLASAPMGVQGLTGFFSPPSAPVAAPAPPQSWPDPLTTLIEPILGAGHGVIMTMGKGGVGKTTIAAAIAVEIARRGLPVHLSTTDPAAHVADAVGVAIPGLSVSRIDPAAETAAYQAEVLAKAGAGLDAHGRALLEEDLRSPCTEEIAVFRAFARAVAKGKGGFVVLDTAPTGHTLLLLDASEAYHREVSRTATDIPEDVRSLLPRLRDPRFTFVLLVTLPEATPVHEAAMLGRDLERADIHPFGWVINASLTPLPVQDPVLRARQAHEAPWIAEVVATHARVALVPYQPDPPTGPERLSKLLWPASIGGPLRLQDEATRPTEPNMNQPSPDQIHDTVRSRYGNIAQTAGSCCAPSCCTPAGALGYSAEEEAAAPEGANLGLGCGNPQAIAALKPGETVLDLGSGAGFDCFLAARAVGPTGRVIGVDMTPEMLSKARANAVKTGLSHVEFRLGQIEHLPVADATVDVIISNCVVNLSPDKPAVFRDAFRVLKPGGRLAIADVVATAPLAPEHQADLALLVGCIAGAATVAEVEGWLRDAGFTDIAIREKDGSRQIVDAWAPGHPAAGSVMSATIEARKP